MVMAFQWRKFRCTRMFSGKSLRWYKLFASSKFWIGLFDKIFWWMTSAKARMSVAGISPQRVQMTHNWRWTVGFDHKPLQWWWQWWWQWRWHGWLFWWESWWWWSNTRVFPRFKVHILVPDPSAKCLLPVCPWKYWPQNLLRIYR